MALGRAALRLRYAGYAGGWCLHHERHGDRDDGGGKGGGGEGECGGGLGGGGDGLGRRRRWAGRWWWGGGGGGDGDGEGGGGEGERSNKHVNRLGCLRLLISSKWSRPEGRMRSGAQPARCRRRARALRLASTLQPQPAAVVTTRSSSATKTAGSEVLAASRAAGMMLSAGSSMAQEAERWCRVATVSCAPTPQGVLSGQNRSINTAISLKFPDQLCWHPLNLERYRED